MEQLTSYLRATVAEMKQVRWPTQNQALIYTALVVGISAAVAVFLGFFDFLFGFMVDIIVNNF